MLGGQRRRRVRPVAGFGAFLHRGRSHEDGELVLVDDEHVDQLQQVRRHVAHRRQVEHHGHPGVSGDARGLDDGVVGDLQAQAQHPGGPDGIAPVADEARVDGAVGAGGNDDAVLRLIVDQDHRRAGGLRRLGQVGHVHAGVDEGIAQQRAIGVRADCAEERRRHAEPPDGRRLIRGLPARQHLQRAAGDGLPRLRQRRHPNGQIGVGRTHHADLPRGGRQDVEKRIEIRHGLPPTRCGT